MSGFPKKIYVTRTADEFPEYFVSVHPNEVAEEEEDETEVAVYQLVKVGQVRKSSKIVFE